MDCYRWTATCNVLYAGAQVAGLACNWCSNVGTEHDRSTISLDRIADSSRCYLVQHWAGHLVPQLGHITGT